MKTPVLFQDWITLRGKQQFGGTGGTTFYAHRKDWLWMGDALALTMTVEVKSIRNITNSSRPKPVLRIETALCEVGPWVAVPFASADGISDPDNYTVNIPMLGESPEIVALKPSLGFVRWAVSDSLMTTDNDEWDVCFRIVAVPTNFQ